MVGLKDFVKQREELLNSIPFDRFSQKQLENFYNIDGLATASEFNSIFAEDVLNSEKTLVKTQFEVADTKGYRMATALNEQFPNFEGLDPFKGYGDKEGLEKLGISIKEDQVEPIDTPGL